MKQPMFSSAFITLAAVFSQVILNLKMSATRENPETIYAGAGQNGAARILSGPVIIKSDTQKILYEISRCISSQALNRSSGDMKKTVYLVST